LLDELGKSSEKKFELGDYFSARLQARYDAQATNQPNGAPVANVINNVAGPRVTTNALSFQEFTLYPRRQEKKTRRLRIATSLVFLNKPNTIKSAYLVLLGIYDAPREGSNGPMDQSLK
jgi:hypothetical protein